MRGRVGGSTLPVPGSYLRRIDSCITQLKAQGPARTCNESKEEEEEGSGRGDLGPGPETVAAAPPPAHPFPQKRRQRPNELRCFRRKLGREPRASWLPRAASQGNAQPGGLSWRGLRRCWNPSVCSRAIRHGTTRRRRPRGRQLRELTSWSAETRHGRTTPASEFRVRSMAGGDEGGGQKVPPRRGSCPSPRPLLFQPCQGGYTDERGRP